MEKDFDVLVVGSGPMGATTALALARYGVRVRLVSRYSWTANSPRAHITNQRAMEVLRDLGVEDAAKLEATPWHLMGDTLFTTSLAGPEIARLRTWGTGDDRAGDYLQGSPCTMLDLPQDRMEPVLVRHAASQGAVVSFNTEYLGHVQDANGVTVTLRDRIAEETQIVRCRYLVGADGAKSKVLDDASLVVEGAIARAATVYVRFHADLSRFVAHRPSILYWIVTSDAAFGEIGLGLLRAVDPWKKWIAGWGFDPATGTPDLSPDAVLGRIRTLVGVPDLEAEIEEVSIWYVNQAFAPLYSKGRVFCGGDAVHRHPPSSGLGSNTSMQDAFNLAWKLAYVVKGHAGEGLLDSYTLERAPVGRQVVGRANQSRLDYAPLNRCFREPGAADPVAAGLEMLASPGTEGVARRMALVEALHLKDFEFNAQGTEMNQRYRSAAVMEDPSLPPEQWTRDPQLYLQPTTRPGAKVPHVWLVGADGKKVSTLDLVGNGKFTLITGIAGAAWIDAANQLGLEYLKTVRIGDVDAQDLYYSWHRIRDMAEDGAILVRPDGVVAWRRLTGVGDAATACRELSFALGTVLSTRSTHE